jgi:hypothetical protein
MLFRDMATVDECWKNVLLNQFHDVLPGSCIEFAAIDAWDIYKQLFQSLMTLRAQYYRRLLGEGTTRTAVFNPLPWGTSTVVFMKPDEAAPPSGSNIQSVVLDSDAFEDEIEGRFRIPSKFSAALVTLQPSGFTQFTPQAPTNPVSFAAGS